MKTRDVAWRGVEVCVCHRPGRREARIVFPQSGRRNCTREVLTRGELTADTAAGFASRRSLAEQNEGPFAVRLAAGIGVAVLQEIAESFLDLHRRQIFEAAGEPCEQPFPTRRFDDDGAARCCAHNDLIPRCRIEIKLAASEVTLRPAL